MTIKEYLTSLGIEIPEQFKDISELKLSKKIEIKNLDTDEIIYENEHITEDEKCH